MIKWFKVLWEQNSGENNGKKDNKKNSTTVGKDR